MSALATPAGSTSTGDGLGGCRRDRATSRTPPPPPRAAPEAASAAASKPSFGQVGCMGKTGGIADHDPDAGSALVARTDVLDPAVVKRDHRAAPVLGEHLRELAACGQGLS